MDKVPLNININDVSMITITQTISASHFAARTSPTTTLVLVTVVTTDFSMPFQHL
jgi:hypothetical protein